MFIQNVCRTKDIFCNVTYKVHRDLNNKINSSPILECPSSAFMHAFNCWVSFTYKSCDRSLWLVIPDHLQCLPAHGGTVNNKRFTKSIKKLLTNKSDKTYCWQSLRYSGVINSTIFIIYYPRDAMLARSLRQRRVCLSVRLSHASIVPSRSKAVSPKVICHFLSKFALLCEMWNVHRLIAPWL